jgi:hypothetical protein
MAGPARNAATHSSSVLEKNRKNALAGPDAHEAQRSRTPAAAGCMTQSRLHVLANQAATQRQRCLGNLGSQAWAHHLLQITVENPHCDCEIIAV